jgi:DNA repair photolyase
MGFRWSSLAPDGTDRSVGSAAGTLFDADSLVSRHVGTGAYAGMEFLEVRARSVVNRVPAGSTMPFEWTINPYRGCTHACSYCFARPTHDYLGLDIAEGFDRQIVVKVNAVEVARAEMAAKKWAGHPIALGTNTDPYQRAEGKYHLTRGLISVMAEARSPFSVLTKSTLILRDIAHLQRAAQRVTVRANLSIGTLDPRVWRLTEPGTPPPWKRMEAVRRLNDAGISCGVFMSPVIPGLSDTDDHLRAVVDAAADAGAVSIGAGYLYLREPVRTVFIDRLRADDPDAAARIDTTYASRSYLPSSAQRHLSDRVATLVRARAGPSLASRSTMTAATGSVSERVRALGLGGPRGGSVEANTRTPMDQLTLL